MQPQYAYPQQPGPQPQYPQQPYAQPQYPVAPGPYPVQPQYPQHPYAQPQPPAQPLPVGNLDDFYQQPSAGGGPSLKFQDQMRQPQLGKTYTGTVERPITNADVRAQTNTAGAPVTYRDGRPKFVMIVPLLVANHPEFPEGKAGWWVKGQARDELARAMAEAGAPVGTPEVGATITVQLVGVQPVPGMNPRFLFRVHYVRPPGTGQPTPVQQPVPAQYAQPMPVQQPTPVQQPVPAQYAQPMPVQQPVPAMPPGLTSDQRALFAQLTGQPVQQPVA